MIFKRKDKNNLIPDAVPFFTTVYSVLYGKTDTDFLRIIDEESTPIL